MAVSLPLLVYHRIEEWLHALIVTALRFDQVYNVELIHCIFPRIFNSEINAQLELTQFYIDILDQGKVLIKNNVFNAAALCILGTIFLLCFIIKESRT
jgi:hypothetical protein